MTALAGTPDNTIRTKAIINLTELFVEEELETDIPSADAGMCTGLKKKNTKNLNAIRYHVNFYLQSILGS